MATKPDYFSAEALRRDLKGKTVRGGLYTAAGQAAITFIGLASVPIMARLLEPADFGLVAMVTVFTGFAAMFVDAGLSMATIQRDRITHQQVSNLFWVASALGIAIAAVVAALAPAIAWFYREPRLVPITLALSLSFIFSGLTIQHQALLRRAMRFKALAVVQVASFALPYAVAIAIAWQYRTYWALVILPIATALLRMVLTWMICVWLPALPRPGVGMRSLAGFGANLTGSTFVNYFARNADNMLIGWWWGDVSLGFYERGYKLMMAPLAQISAPLAQLMIPVLSRLQDQPEKYRKAYFQAVGLLQMVACPLMAFVAVAAPWIVDVVFGPGWEEVGPIVRWLAVAGFVQPIASSVGWLYVSQGRARDLFQWTILGASLILTSFVAGLGWGPTGVAAAYAIVMCFVTVPLAYWYVGEIGHVSMFDLWRLTALAVVYSAPTVVVTLFAMLRYPELSSIVGIAVCGCLSVATTAAVIFGSKVRRTQSLEILGLIHNALGASRIARRFSSREHAHQSETSSH